MGERFFLPPQFREAVAEIVVGFGELRPERQCGS